MTTATNSGSPSQSAAIFKLPDDILSLIFLCGYVQGEDYDKYIDDDDVNVDEIPDHAALTSSKHGRTLASVCHRWRRLALDMAQLWTNISLDTPEYAAALIERTREARLAIFCTLPDQTSETFWEGVSKLLPECMDRVQNLFVGTQKHQTDERLWTLLSRPQALKGLVITGSGYLDGGAPHSLSQNVPLDNMSSLSSLCLNAVCLQKDLPSIPTLRRLAVTDNFEEYSGLSDGLRNENLSIAWLLRSLPKIPNVESVDAAVVSVGTLPVIQLPQPIMLPQLEFLVLMCTDVASTAIFKSLTISQTITINITFDYKSPDHLKTDGMTALLARYQRRSSAELYLTVKMDVGSENGTQLITLLLTEGGFYCPTCLTTPFGHETFLEYVSLMPLERLHTLEYVAHISPGQAVPIDLWIDVMPLCPHLRKLVLTASAEIDLLRGYIERYVRSRRPEHGAVNPQLSHLNFKEVEFEVEGEATKEYDGMLESLDELRRAKLRIELVTLDHCNISQGSVAKLRERISNRWSQNSRGLKAGHTEPAGEQRQPQ